jgi:hypothetical protein
MLSTDFSVPIVHPISDLSNISTESHPQGTDVLDQRYIPRDHVPCVPELPYPNFVLEDLLSQLTGLRKAIMHAFPTASLTLCAEVVGRLTDRHVTSNPVALFEI